MKTHVLVMASMVGLSSLLAVACGGSSPATESGVDDATSARLAPGDFKLYTSPRVTPDAKCDYHTVLTLTGSPSPKADLREHVAGPCALLVDYAPDPRTYDLTFVSSGCGSPIYEGFIRNGRDVRSVKITDHRNRTCRDLVPAKVIVEERRLGPADAPITTTLYSYDGAPSGGDVVCQGSTECGAGEHCSTEDGVCNSTGMLAVCSGTCVADAPAATVCQSSAQCASDERCSTERGVCDSTGMLAVCSGTCEKKPAPSAVCQGSEQCAAGEYCTTEDGDCNRTGMLAVCSGFCAPRTK